MVSAARLCEALSGESSAGVGGPAAEEPFSKIGNILLYIAQAAIKCTACNGQALSRATIQMQTVVEGERTLQGQLS